MHFVLELKQNKAEANFEKIWGRGNAFRTLGIGVAVALGGFLSELSFEITVVLSAISVLMVSVVAFLWPEVDVSESTEKVKYWQFIRSSLKTVTGNRALLQLMIYTAIVLALLASIEEYNDIYLSFLGFPRYLIGIIFAVAASVQAIASSLAYKYKKYSWRLINLSVIASSAILLATSLFKNPFMAIGILFLGVLLEFISVLKEGLVQKETKSYQRATVSSVSGLIMNMLPYQLFFGVMSYRLGSMQAVYGIFGLFVLSYFVFQYILKLHAKDENC